MRISCAVAGGNGAAPVQLKLASGPSRGIVVVLVLDAPASRRRDPPNVAVDLTGRPSGIGPLWGMQSDELNATLLEWPPGGGVAEHVNDELEVMLLVLAGSARVSLDGVEHELPAGSLLLVPRGCARSVAAGSDGVRYLSVHRRRAPLLPARARPRGALTEHDSSSDVATLERWEAHGAIWRVLILTENAPSSSCARATASTSTRCARAIRRCCATSPPARSSRSRSGRGAASATSSSPRSSRRRRPPSARPARRGCRSSPPPARRRRTGRARRGGRRSGRRGPARRGARARAPGRSGRRSPRAAAARSGR